MLRYRCGGFMEDNVIHKLIGKVKNKVLKRSNSCPSDTEYAFSPEELADLNKQNKQKLQDLKQDLFSEKEKPVENGELLDEALNSFQKQEGDLIQKNSLESVDSALSKDEVEDVDDVSLVQEEKESIHEVNDDLDDKKPKNSFVHLGEEHQSLVMEKWNEIDSNMIDQDILLGKEIINHNYTITYADDAARFVHDIRKKYEVVLCYLIGFNNEKKGVFDKTIFSSKMDDEWKFLGQYIKILEKIRNFKK